LPSSHRFNFRSSDGLGSTITDLGLDIRLDVDLSPLNRRVRISLVTAPNTLALHPMEGCDGNADGSPGELTVRRYERFARGGAGLMWFEATAITPECRSNAHQLWLSHQNVAEYARLLERVQRVARETNGLDHDPVTVVQLTHPGRLVKRDGRRAPAIAYHHPILDPAYGLSPDYPVITDDELEALEDQFVMAARLAYRAGFTGVDIKSCHRYLIAELLTAHRRSGRYGGSFENRTRFLVNVVEKIRGAVPELLLAVRLNGHDGVEHPHIWGMNQEIPDQVDLTEPISLVRLLYQKGVRLLSVSLGRRPQRSASRGDQWQPIGAVATEHPLELIADHITTTRTIQQAVPEMVVMGAGYSWLRQYFPNVAAATVNGGWARMVGLGREALAYPNFARDLREHGALNPRKVCLACGKCSQLLAVDTPVGCVVRDASVYLPIYREHCPKPSGAVH